MVSGRPSPKLSSSQCPCVLLTRVLPSAPLAPQWHLHAAPAAARRARWSLLPAARLSPLQAHRTPPPPQPPGYSRPRQNPRPRPRRRPHGPSCRSLRRGSSPFGSSGVSPLAGLPRTRGHATAPSPNESTPTRAPCQHGRVTSQIAPTRVNSRVGPIRTGATIRTLWPPSYARAPHHATSARGASGRRRHAHARDAHGPSRCLCP